MNTLTINWTNIDQSLPHESTTEISFFVEHARIWAEKNNYKFDTVRDTSSPSFYLVDSNGDRIEDVELIDNVWVKLLESCPWDQLKK